jgi:hypothetical protein
MDALTFGPHLGFEGVTHPAAGRDVFDFDAPFVTPPMADRAFPLGEGIMDPAANQLLPGGGVGRVAAGAGVLREKQVAVHARQLLVLLQVVAPSARSASTRQIVVRVGIVASLASSLKRPMDGLAPGSAFVALRASRGKTGFQ